MKLPRNLSGRQLSQVLVQRFQYRVVHERGSHIVLETQEPSHQRIAVPDHKNLRIGTLSAIVRAIAKHKGLGKDEILTWMESS